MQGLELNGNLLAVGAKFVKATKTAPLYRLWSIDDRYPAMQRVDKGGSQIDLEVWSLSPTALVQILQQEPPGLCIGNVKLIDDSELFGVLGEAVICETQVDITAWGGWRAYLVSLPKS